MTSDSASRVTRSRRSLQRSLLLTAAVLAGVTVLRAQETPPAAAPAGQATPAATAPPAGPTAPAATAPPARNPATAADAAAAPASTAPPATPGDTPAPAAGKPGGKVGPTRDRFEPSEKVRADFDVSFPVDI